MALYYPKSVADAHATGQTGEAAARGNLALALSEMGLLDASRDSWREAEPAAAN